MTSLLHIHSGESGARLLDSVRSMGVQVIDASPDADTLQRAAEEARADTAVIGADVDAPLRIARAVHSAAPQAHIVFITNERSEAALRRELTFAPRIGRYWSVARADAPAAAEEVIRNALQSSTQRKNLRTTIGRVNLQLRDHEATPRPVLSDHLLAAVLQQLSDGVIMTDDAGLVLVANEASRRIFGPRLTRGVPLAAALPPGSEHLVSHFTSAETDTTTELSFDREGETAIIEARVTGVRNEVGESVGTAIVTRDITERRLTEGRRRLVAELSVALSSTSDLDAAMQRLSDFLAATFHAIAAVDLVTEETFSRCAITVPGGDRGDGAGSPRTAVPMNSHPAVEAFRTGAAVLREEADDEFLRHVAGDQEEFRILMDAGARCIAVVPIRRGDHLAGAMTVARTTRFTGRDVRLLEDVADITARTTENILLYRAAEQANRAKEEFLAMLSHELRTPMTSVLGWIELLRDGMPDVETLHDGLDSMRQSARTQAQLIDDLLDISRIQSGKMHLEIKVVDVAQLAQLAVDALRPAAVAKRLEMKTSVDERLYAYADPNRLHQVVWNLLTNAVKFTEQGGSVTVSVAAAGAEIRIDVADTGRGIEREFLPYVFDRFSQADSTANRQFGGLGLGLAIVRQITELHGGTVAVASDGLGCGARFTVRLPRAEQDHRTPADRERGS